MITRRHMLAAILAAPTLRAGDVFAADKGVVGISMPGKSVARWVNDARSMSEFLQAAGYATDVQFADDDVPNQIAQLENMITGGRRALVIAPIDGKTLTDVLQKAKDRDIKVIDYERLILGTPNVDYYATFDNFRIGAMQAQAIVDKLGLPDAKGPFNIELFAGSLDDNNAHVVFEGGMSVLSPYISSGKLVVQSHQLDLKQVATPGWSPANAQARMDNLLSAFYTNKKLEAVLSPYDGMTTGMISSLKSLGYGQGDLPMPIMGGQDAEIPAIKAIIAGDQYSTLFKDTRALAKVAAGMVDAALSGRNPEINDDKNYNNGVKVVPAQLLVPILVTKSNWKSVLVDSGYYKMGQIL
jgi:putative multiple sugar transport system substrate-binding protein